MLWLHACSIMCLNPIQNTEHKYVHTFCWFYSKNCWQARARGGDNFEPEWNRMDFAIEGDSMVNFEWETN